MGIQKATDHDRDVSGTVWRPLDPRQLCSVPWISNRDAAQTLDALGEEVGQLELPTGVLGSMSWFPAVRLDRRR